MKKTIFIILALFIIIGSVSGCIDLPWEYDVKLDVKVTAHVIDDDPDLYNMTGNYTLISGLPSSATVYTFTPDKGSNTTGVFEQIATISLEYDNDTITIPEAKQYTGSTIFEWDGEGAICLGYRNETTRTMDGICMAIVDFSQAGGTVADCLEGTVTVHHWLPITG